MNAWPDLPFLDALSDTTRGNPKTPQSEYQASGRYAVVDQGKKLVAGYTDNPDLLYGGESPVIVFGDHTRHFKYVDFPFCMGADGVKVLRPNGDWDVKFLYYYLSSLNIPSAGYSRHFKFLKEQVVPRPPIHEQRRIAAVLDHANELRAKRRQALDHLDDLTQSMLLDMFGDPAANPRGWGSVRCQDVCRRVTVGIVFQPASYYQEAGIPALRSLNIRPGEIVLDNVVHFSEQANETTLAKTRIWEDDVVLVRTGRPGTAAVVPGSLNGANAIDVLITTPDKSQVDPVYLCSFFNSPAGKRIVLGQKRGQIQEHLNVGSLKAVALPLPPVALQQEFARRVREVDKLRATCRTSLAELDALFASVRDRAFKGLLWTGDDRGPLTSGKAV